MIDYFRLASGILWMIATVGVAAILIIWASNASSKQHDEEYQKMLRDWCRWEMWAPENIKSWGWWEIYTKC